MGLALPQVHAIIPYFSYARSDKKDAPRISIAARLVADLLETAGATHIMTMTLHSPQVHGFFGLPTDPLTARHLFNRYFLDKEYSAKETIVIAPDVGRAKPAARFAAQLGLPTAAAQKERLSDTRVVIDRGIDRMVIGFHRALVYDDEIATGTTVIGLCDRLVRCGIEEIILICTHGVFSGDALPQLGHIPQIREIVTTDTVPMPPEKLSQNMTVLSVAPIFGEAIWRNSTRQSIGEFFLSLMTHLIRSKSTNKPPRSQLHRWKNSDLKDILAEPRTSEDLHIPQNLVIDLIFRLLYNEGNVALVRFTDVLKIPKTIIDDILLWMQKEHLVEVSKASMELGRLGNVYTLTDAGEERARICDGTQPVCRPSPGVDPVLQPGDRAADQTTSACRPSWSSRL